MKYDRLIRVLGAAIADPNAEEKVRALTNEIARLKEEKSSMQTELEQKSEVEPEQKFLRNDDDSIYLLSLLQEYGEKYFNAAGLKMANAVCKPWVWNIPTSLMEGIRGIREEGYPDILNPAILLYLFMTDDPGGCIGKFLLTLRKIMDDNAQAIQDDAAAWDAEMTLPDEDEDEDDDEDDSDIEGALVDEPGKWMEEHDQEDMELDPEYGE